MLTLLTAFERAAIAKLLEGDYPELAILRHQAELAEVAERSQYWGGVSIALAVPDDCERATTLPQLTRFDDVIGVVSGMRNPVGFSLSVVDGMLDELEGSTFEEQWKEHPDEWRVEYPSGQVRDERYVRQVIRDGIADWPVRG